MKSWPFGLGVAAFFAGLIAQAYALAGWAVTAEAGALSRAEAQLFLGLGLLGAVAVASGLLLTDHYWTSKVTLSTRMAHADG